MERGGMILIFNRWTSPDTIVPDAAQGVQAWDRYAYTNNNPVRYSDPSGHCIGPLLAVCLAIGSFIVDNAAIITSVATAGAILSFVGPSNPDPKLINDPVASQQAFVDLAFQAGLWLSGGTAAIEFGQLTSLPSSNASTKNIPSPNGRLGGQLHQTEVSNIEQDVTGIYGSGFQSIPEYRIETPGGLKPYNLQM